MSIDVYLPKVVVTLLHRPFKGYQCASTHSLVDGVRTLLWRTNLLEKVVKKVQIGASAPGDGPLALADQATQLLVKMPYLIAHCSVVKYEDGSARRPGWFTVKVMGAQWIVQVKDPDSCAQMQVGAMNIDDAIIMVELLLGSDAAPWEPDPFLRKLSQGGKK